MIKCTECGKTLKQGKTYYCASCDADYCADCSCWAPAPIKKKTKAVLGLKKRRRKKKRG